MKLIGSFGIAVVLTITLSLFAAAEEKKGRENEIGRRPAVPFGMRDGPISFFVAAGIVHQDHARDGEAAEDVQAH